MELEILETEFAHFTPEVRNHIVHLVRSKRCDDTSDVVIDGLWEACRDEMIAILDQPHPANQLAVQDSDGQLLHESRNLIRSYVDRALNREADLGDLDADKFEDTYKAIIAPLVQAKRERQSRSARENDRWAFFNQLDADADFERWRERLLSPEQAVALSFGKDPDVVTPESLKPYRAVARSPFREAFKDRLDLIEAAVAAGDLSVPMSVSAFVQWATIHGLVPPQGLLRKPAKFDEDDATFWKLKYEEVDSALKYLRQDVSKINAKSRTSLYIMILGMAISRYGHKTIGNTSATSAIRGSIEEIGLTIDHDAILGHLRDAASALDFEWRDPLPRAGRKQTTS